jgi:hypothetical protein
MWNVRMAHSYSPFGAIIVSVNHKAIVSPQTTGALQRVKQFKTG